MDNTNDPVGVLRNGVREAIKCLLNATAAEYVVTDVVCKLQATLDATNPAAIQHSEQRETVPAGQVPKSNDGKEQDAFEAWGKGERYDMTTHPMHWLFLNERTYAARQGWKAALEYVNTVLAAHVAAPVPEAKAEQVGDDTLQSDTEMVLAEVRQARANWPGFNSAHEGYAVLAEEVDELWAHVKTNQKRRDLPAMKKEAMQVAAMALRFMGECCDETTGRK